MEVSVLKKIIIIVLVLFAFVDLYAAREIDLGGKMGLGIGWWRGDTYGKDVDITGGFNATFGAYTSIELHKHVALQTELLFSFLANGDEKRYSNFKVERSFRNVAFEIPVY